MSGSEILTQLLFYSVQIEGKIAVGLISNAEGFYFGTEVNL